MRLGLGAVPMQPRFSKQIVAVISLCLTVVAAWHCSLENSVRLAAIDCTNWNSNEYFEAATAADVTDCLRSGADLEARTEDGFTPLHWAARGNDNPAVIAALLDAGADLKARTEDGLTPLHWAAGWTPLHWAAGWTPLHWAARFTDNPAVIAALVDAGADLEARTEGGLTPLHWAARGNENKALLTAPKSNPAVIAALLDAGADLTACRCAGLPVRPRQAQDARLLVYFNTNLVSTLSTGGAPRSRRRRCCGNVSPSDSLAPKARLSKPFYSRPPFPSPWIIPDRSSPSRVRFAASRPGPLRADLGRRAVHEGKGGIRAVWTGRKGTFRSYWMP